MAYDPDGGRSYSVGRRGTLPGAPGLEEDGAKAVRLSGGSRPRSSCSVGTVTDQVHNRIAMIRAERGISRRELSEAVGVHYQTIGYLERGEYSPSLHLALKIAEYFQVPVEVIFSISAFARLGSEQTG